MLSWVCLQCKPTLPELQLSPLAPLLPVPSCLVCLGRVYQALQRFTVLDLSNFYLDVAKDRLVRSPG